MSYRKQQVESTLQRAVSKLVGQLSDPRVTGLVSVTRVDLTPDGHSAFVYVSVIPEEHQKRVMAGLSHAVGHIQKQLRDEVVMRYVPRLEFRLDASLKKQSEVWDAISRGGSSGDAGVGPEGGRVDRVVGLGSEDHSR